MKSWEKNFYFGSRIQPLPFWTEGSHTADGVPTKIYLELAYTLSVCLPWQSGSSKEFSVKDDKTRQWKICLCKIEIFKITLLPNCFLFSVTILWGQTKLNWKKNLFVEQKGNLLLSQFNFVLCLSPPPPGNSVLCHAPFCWISLGLTVNAVFLYFSFYLKYWHPAAVFIWNIGIIGTLLPCVKGTILQYWELLDRT